MSLKRNAYWMRVLLAKPSQGIQYRECMAHDGWSVEQLHNFNWKKRLYILKFAYENSPYYEALYKAAGLEPGDIKSEADWEKIPMLTREALRESFDTIQVRRPEGSFQMYTTGGSTGEPSKVLKDDRFSSTALNWRALAWANVSPGDNSAVIMRSHHENWKARFRHFLAHWPSAHFMLDAGTMTENKIDEFLRKWRRYRPIFISSYVGGIHQLAVHCLEHRIDLPPPEAIFTTAAPLPLPIRQDIVRAFKCPVYDNYVATEAHPMANQCRHLAENNDVALHVHSDYRHLEFVDVDGHAVSLGKFGDVLVTDLGDQVFPIIRYRIGDRGRWLDRKCLCGRPYPLMDAVHGRSFDFIYLENGRLAGECWATAFDQCLNAIHNFQIHQFADKSVTLAVVMNKNYPNAEKCIRMVAADLQRQLGTIPLNLEFRDFIPHNRGKIKYIISDVR